MTVRDELHVPTETRVLNLPAALAADADAVARGDAPLPDDPAALDYSVTFSDAVVACLASARGRELLPGSLKDARVLYQVRPVLDSGAVLVCAEREPNGHVCTLLPANLLAPLSDVCAACGRAAGDGTACEDCPVRDLASA